MPLISSIIFAALVSFIYDLDPQKTYEACYLPAGGQETCTPMSNSPKQITVPDDTLIEFYLKVDGVKSAVTSYKTAPPFFVAPTIVVES